jgi:hypothetical protein
MVLWCKGGEQEIRHLMHMRKHAGPTPVTQKHGHYLYLTLLNQWLLAGTMVRYGDDRCSR